jgi:uncharacterized protein
MNKWLFWGVIALAAFIVWKIHAGKKKRQAEQAAAAPARPAKPATALILACAHCGVHLPKEEAQEKNGQWYCSTQHADVGPRV